MKALREDRGMAFERLAVIVIEFANDEIGKHVEERPPEKRLRGPADVALEPAVPTRDDKVGVGA